MQVQDRWDFTEQGADVRPHMEFPCIGLGDQAPLDSLQPDAVDMDLEDEDARERRACNFVRRYPVPVAAGNTANVKTEKGAKADRASFADRGSFASTSDRAASAAAALARDNA